MASWITHIRIAEHFISKYEKLNNIDFLVGNIAPDCGVPNEDNSEYTPNKNVTHWFNDIEIEANGFREKYLQDKNNKFPFYLGYYFHLITDKEWTKFINRKRNVASNSERITDKNLINDIKQDMYAQDKLYLRDNQNSIFFTVFSRIDEFPNSYLDFYPIDAFINQIKYITDYYSTADETAERVLPFINKSDMDGFIKDAITLLESHELI